jgi:hypothetical protein
MRVLRCLVGGSLVLLLTSVAALAQVGSTAQISGTVKDESGGVLPGVDVTVVQTDTGASRATVTDASGAYVLPNLPIGPYRLEVTLAGFRPYTQTGIVLQVGSSPSLNVTLGVGALTEAVTVEAAAPLVDTQRAGIGQVIESARIVELPLNGRNPTDLIELTGAAVNVQSEGATTRSMPGGQGISVAGGQTFGTAYILDGAMHNNPYDNLNLPLPFPDALQEFRVETGALSAGAGVHSGASVNAVTKSGTNVFHGEIFEFWRNKRFNATNPFAGTGPDGKRRDDGLNRNQFGGTFGGPVIRDRVHFFAGYEGTIIRQTPADNISFVPTAAMLAGDFTAVASPQCNAGQQLTLRGPFVNNRVDPSLFSRAASNLARRLPTSDDPCGRVVYGFKNDSDRSQVVTKVDYQVAHNHSMFGRYIATPYNSPAPLASSNNLLASQTGTANVTGFDNMAQSFTLGENWVMGPNTVNAFRFAWNRTDIHRFHQGYFAAPELGVNMFSYLDDYFILNVTGAFQVGNGVQNEARFKTQTFQVGDDLTMIRGNHQFAVGVNIARWTSYNEAHVRSPGSFTVNGQTTGLALADFMMGNVSEFLQAAPNILDMYQWYTGFYAADTWRLSSRMTFNYGLRWEPFFPQQLPNGYIYNFSLDRFNQGIKSQVFQNAPAGFLYPGDDDFVGGNSGMNKNWKNFAPRIGVAWDPTGDGRTSVRAGYSLAYDFVNAQYHLNTSIAPPWGAEVRIPSVSLDNPYATFPGGNPFPRTFDANAAFPQFGSFLAIDPDTKNTRMHSYNVAVQKQLGTNMVVSATYLGNRTNHLWNMKALNPAVFMGLGPCVINGVSYPTCSTTANTNQRRRLFLENPAEGQFIGQLDLHDASGRSTYNGVLLSFQRRAAKGLELLGNYTLSKCESHPTTSLPNVGTGWADPENPDYDYGPCNTDRRHIVNMTASVQTPEFSGAVARALVSGWRASGIFRASSGAPLNVTTGQDRALTGIVTNQRADQILDDPYGDGSANNYLNRAAFAQPALGTLGNSPRGGYRGPSRWTVDMVLARMFSLGVGQRIEVRVEAFNLTNHPNLENTTQLTSISNANFGRIQQLALGTTPRVLQFGVKYGF